MTENGGIEKQETEGGPDELPEDLQPLMADFEDYLFPDNDRRRVPGYLYLATAFVLLGLAVAFPDTIFMNIGMVLAALALGLFGVYSVFAGVKIKVDEREALAIAVPVFGHTVGHASAQMSWHRSLSHPLWRILLYSADDPPTYRGFVIVDATTGEVLDSISEENPEDWAKSNGSGN